MKARAALLLISLLIPFPAYCEKYALLMLIGEFQPGKNIPWLDGTKEDVKSAKLIARQMGVPEKNIYHYTNDKLTLGGIRKTLDDFAARISKDDQVFIYYSGHGTRAKVVESGGTRCGESLVTYDGGTLPDAEFEEYLRQLANKASKMIVLADACHSGGFATRSLGGDGGKAKLRAKSIELDKTLACEQPVNAVTRSIAAAAETPGKGGENYVYIAAARDNEVSFDTDEGGLATMAWRDCMNGAAKDTDESGGLTAEEIESCAQELISKKVRHTDDKAIPHHVSITGNRKQVLKLAERALPATGNAVGKVSSPLNTLQDIYNSRDDRRIVNLVPTSHKFKINQDRVEFSLKSSHQGYVYILMVGSDGTSFDLLFPNQLDRDNRINAGEMLRLPRPAWSIKARGPAGQNHILALVTDSERDFRNLGMKAAGPFSVLPVSSSTAVGIQAIAEGSSRTAALPECSDQSVTRTLEVQRNCSNAYGAALTVIEEAD